MGKRRSRAKRKASFVQEFIPGLVVLLAMFLYLNGVSFDKAFSYVAAGMVFLLIALVAVWFVRGSLKSSEPVNLKKEQPRLRKKAHRSISPAMKASQHRLNGAKS